MSRTRSDPCGTQHAEDGKQAKTFPKAVGDIPENRSQEQQGVIVRKVKRISDVLRTIQHPNDQESMPGID
jgi:hypothetical protein